MRPWRPTVPEERWLALAARYPALRPAIEARGVTGPWKQVSARTRGALFVLGFVLAGLVGSVAMLLGLPDWLTGLLMLVAAEWLIRTRGMFGCGIDEALMISGASTLTMVLFADVFVGTTLWPWIVAVVAMLLALRLLSPWLAAVAAAAVTAGIVGNLGPDRITTAALMASGTSFALALGALALGGRLFARPAHDRMLDATLLLTTVCTYAWGLVATQWPGASASAGAVGPLADVLPDALVTALGAAALFVGIRRRTEAPLWAALICAAALVVEALRRVDWDLSTQLIVAGAVTLVAAVAIERGLRKERRGFTSRRLEPEGAFADVLQVGAAAGLGAATSPARPEEFTGAGGRFGGGGASGNF